MSQFCYLNPSSSSPRYFPLFCLPDENYYNSVVSEQSGEGSSDRHPYQWFLHRVFFITSASTFWVYPHGRGSKRFGCSPSCSRMWRLETIGCCRDELQCTWIRLCWWVGVGGSLAGVGELLSSGCNRIDSALYLDRQKKRRSTDSFSNSSLILYNWN
jgi:hypothetical protein